MPILKFTKMQSLGNDFMVVDSTKSNFSPNLKQLKYWSNRNLGVGFDQFLLVGNSTLPNIDFKYRIFNADGSEVEQCGNGARCLMKFVLENNLISKHKIKVETANRILMLEKLFDDYLVNIGKPDFMPTNISIKAKSQKGCYQIEFEGNTLPFQAVSMGNPHAVFTVGEIANYPVAEVGAFVESHPMFPQKTNVNFMQIINKKKIILQTFERSVGQTLACGSGACAAVVCGIKANLLDNKVTVSMNGGELTINWQEQQDVLMQGDAHTIYQGKINYD